jgi:hypothetical protein
MTSADGMKLAQLLLNGMDHIGLAQNHSKAVPSVAMGWPTADVADDPLMAQSYPKAALPIAPSWPSFSAHDQRRWHGISPAPLEWGIVDDIGLAQNYSKAVLLVVAGWPTTDPADDPLMAQSYPKAALPVASCRPSSSVNIRCQWQGIGPGPLERGVADGIGLAQNHSNT